MQRLLDDWLVNYNTMQSIKAGTWTAGHRFRPSSTACRPDHRRHKNPKEGR